MLAAIAIIVAIGLAFLIAGQFKAHERETGLPPPSPEILADIRRDAAERGVTEQRAHGDWIAREQRKRGRKV